MPLSSLIFVTIFAVATFFKWGAFVYTLKPRGFVFLGQPHARFKPMLPMFWYGWVVTSLAVTATAAAMLRFMLTKPIKLPPFLYWTIPTASGLYVIYTQLSWFNA